MTRIRPSIGLAAEPVVDGWALVERCPALTRWRSGSVEASTWFATMCSVSPTRGRLEFGAWHLLVPADASEADAEAAAISFGFEACDFRWTDDDGDHRFAVAVYPWGSMWTKGGDG